MVNVKCKCQDLNDFARQENLIDAAGIKGQSTFLKILSLSEKTNQEVNSCVITALNLSVTV